MDRPIERRWRDTGFDIEKKKREKLSFSLFSIYWGGGSPDQHLNNSICEFYPSGRQCNYEWRVWFPILLTYMYHLLNIPSLFMWTVDLWIAFSISFAFVGSVPQYAVLYPTPLSSRHKRPIMVRTRYKMKSSMRSCRLVSRIWQGPTSLSHVWVTIYRKMHRLHQWHTFNYDGLHYQDAIPSTECTSISYACEHQILARASTKVIKVWCLFSFFLIPLHLWLLCLKPPEFSHEVSGLELVNFSKPQRNRLYRIWSLVELNGTIHQHCRANKSTSPPKPFVCTNIRNRGRNSNTNDWYRLDLNSYEWNEPWSVS
jgi:hypothetical protein